MGNPTGFINIDRKTARPLEPGERLKNYKEFLGYVQDSLSQSVKINVLNLLNKKNSDLSKDLIKNNNECHEEKEFSGILHPLW